MQRQGKFSIQLVPEQTINTFRQRMQEVRGKELMQREIVYISWKDISRQKKISIFRAQKSLDF